MNRRDAVVAGAAGVAVAGSVGTAYLGTGWARDLASLLRGSLNFMPSIGAGVGRPSLPTFGDGRSPALGAPSLTAVPSPTATKPIPTAHAFLATVAPDPESAISARALQAELDHLPLADMLTYDERNDLQWMRVEENLARDVYRALFLKWGKGPFAAIAASEATHGDAMRQLLLRYNIADPAPGPEGASATDATFGGMYRELVNAGSKSYVDALRTAANIEELDIHDLRDRRSTRPDVSAVYHHLEDGSRVSLRAFVQEIERQGVAWVPSYLKPAEVSAIMDRSAPSPTK